MTPAVHITVCVCTYRRPALLGHLLEKLRDQTTRGLFTYSIVVADNDAGRSAREVVGVFAAAAPVETVYCVEPERNIALARNRALAHARGDFVALIDDDEFPGQDWLLRLWTTCTERHVDGVLGPVLPHFEQPPPQWVRRGRFCDRPTHDTGFVINWREARTGNVLLRRQAFAQVSGPFRAEFGTGGEDVDFFRRLTADGRVFIWCQEAPVHEVVPPARCTRTYMLGRALLRGKNSLKHPAGRGRRIAKSLVAVPLYAGALPFLYLPRHDLFMKYLIKLCDHAGRLLALLRVDFMKKRTM